MTNVKIISCASDVFKLDEAAVTEEIYNKLPKQCKVLVDILKEDGCELTRADFRDKLVEATETIVKDDKGIEHARLETGQDVMKILGYYKKPLENVGVLTVIKPPKSETKIKVASKKKKEAAAEEVQQ